VTLVTESDIGTIRTIGLRAASALVLLAGGLLALSSCAGASAGDGVSRTGYITVTGGIKLAYDLTLPAAHGRFPVALEYDDYTV
jgi:hypothetical protein